MSQCDSKRVGDEREKKGREVEAFVRGQVCCVVMRCGWCVTSAMPRESGRRNGAMNDGWKDPRRCHVEMR
jgi:hypothetical protein